MNDYAVYFWPRGSLASPLRSDTIFGAVCWGIHLLGLTDINRLLREFEPPAFAFSSPSPVYRRGEEELRFFPWPVSLSLGQAELRRLAEVESRRRGVTLKEALAGVTQGVKKLKKYRYLSAGLFEEWVAGRLSGASLYERLPEPRKPETGEVDPVGPALLSRAERRRISPAGPLSQWFLETEAVQHNQIDRVAGATVEGQLFYDNETFFAPGAGLWCLLRTEAATLERWIKPALRYLADTGLGANRTVGKGHFQIEVKAAPALPDAGREATGLVILSRYLPRPEEWSPADRPLAYELLTVTARREKKFARRTDGRQAPIYKRQLRLLQAGSVVPLIPANGSGIYGRLAEVVPPEGDNPPVWQSGLALGIRAKVEASDG